MVETDKDKSLTDLVEQYRRDLSYLVDDDFVDTNAQLTLMARDAIEDHIVEFPDVLLRAIDELDRQLAAKHALAAEGFPYNPKRDRRRWWMFLHEGPQVREEAEKMRVK